MHRHHHTRAHGFSLIQISILLAAGAIVLASVLPGGEGGDFNQKTTGNIAKLDKIEARMNTFMASHGRRPCPAGGQYDVNEHNFGLEAANQGSCTGGTPAAPMGPDATGYVVAGNIPTKTLGLPDDYAFDGWGRRFTYVVDKRATSITSCYALQAANSIGGIAVSLKNSAGATVQTDNVMYTYISHGADGHGAWPAQGSTVANRINKGITDADSLTNAGVDNAFAVSFTNGRVKKDRTTTFDDLVYYHSDTMNTCCVGTSCGATNSNGSLIQGNLNLAATAFAVGDVNGDGIDDLIIGDASYNGNIGRVYVIFGSLTPWTSPFDVTTLNGTNGFIITGAVANDHFGSSIAVGDINGDGVKDIIILSPNASTHGKVYVIAGKKTAWAATFDITTINGTNGFVISPGVNNLSYGVSSGDINGDGYDDVILSEAGLYTFVVFGSGTWTNPFNLSTINGTTGFRVDTAAEPNPWTATGDINGDGIADLIIGMPAKTAGGNAGAGKTYVIFGKTAGWVTTITASSYVDGTTGFVANGVAANDASGSNVAAFDMNGDSIADLIISAPETTVAGRVQAGSVYVVYGKNTAWAASLNLSTLNGATTGARYDGAAADELGTAGSSTAIQSCDINGDGIPDLLIGAPFASTNTHTNNGVTYAVLGKTSGWASTNDLSALNGTTGFRIDGSSDSDELGQVLALGDVNRTGKCAIIAEGWNSNATHGYVYVIQGKNAWPASFDLGLLR